MAFSFLKKLFGSDAPESGELPPIVKNSSVESPEHSERPSVAVATAPCDADALPGELQEAAKAIFTFVEYVVKALVDEPEQVRMAFVQKGDLTILQIHCFKKDIGKIIGKQGKTISSLRLLVSGIGARFGHRFSVDVLDD